MLSCVSVVWVHKQHLIMHWVQDAEDGVAPDRSTSAKMQIAHAPQAGPCTYQLATVVQTHDLMFFEL